MADYKRMVSYMYQYENGEKRKNVGFAKVEVRGGQCKITLHMQLLGQLDSIFPTYLIQRAEGDLELIYLGDALLKNQVMDSRLIADETNIMGSNYQLSDMGGLLLFLNDNVFFATEWDDKPIIAAQVLEALRPKKVKQTVKYDLEPDTGIFLPEEETMEQTAEIDEEIYHTEDTFTQDMVIADTIAEQQQPERSLEEELRTPRYKLPGGWKMVERLQKPDTNKEPVIPDLQEFSAAECNKEKADSCLPDHPTAKHIFDDFPRIYPFEDNEIILCVKIEPKDIGLLPREIWPYNNNSFLMHGFYCYHHLIFAKMKYRMGCCYILGIPGIFHNRERFMAKMFGFESFKSIRKRELKQGDFGYWYLPVYFPE